jgi:excisionase family DNA binding protein
MTSQASHRPKGVSDRALSLATILLTVEQVALRCNCSERTVRRWIENEDLRCHRIGRLLRISEADLADFLARQRSF